MSSEVNFLSEASQAIGLKADMDSRTQILTAKQYKSKKTLKKYIPRSQVVRIIDGEDKIKKHRRTSLKYNSKNWMKKLEVLYLQIN